MQGFFTSVARVGPFQFCTWPFLRNSHNFPRRGMPKQTFRKRRKTRMLVLSQPRKGETLHRHGKGAVFSGRLSGSRGVRLVHLNPSSFTVLAKHPVAFEAARISFEAVSLVLLACPWSVSFCGRIAPILAWCLVHSAPIAQRETRLRLRTLRWPIHRARKRPTMEPLFTTDFQRSMFMEPVWVSSRV